MKWIWLAAALVTSCPAFAAPPKGHEAESQAALHLTSVHFSGVSALDVKDLTRQLPIPIGDRWKGDYTQIIRNILTEYYVKRGFYHSSVDVIPAVDPVANTVDIEIKITEGPPCVVSSLVIPDPEGFPNPHARDVFKKRILDVLKISIGDRYDEERITDQLRVLREWLVSKDYVLANTDNVHLTYNPDQTQVVLQLNVFFGDRITFGYEGNTLFAKSEFSGFIAELRTTGLGKDFIGTLVRKFQEEYRAKAYNDVQIDAHAGELGETKRVTFVINEGTRTELESVSFEGLSTDNQKKAQEIFKKSTSRLIQRGYYVAKDVEKGVQLVLEDLRSRGFLSSKLVAKNTQVVKTKFKSEHIVRVSLQFSEGEQTLINEVKLIGFTYLTTSQIQEILGVAPGKPMNPYALEEGIQHLKTRYVSDGFLEYQVTTLEKDIVLFSENNRVAEIHLTVMEGPRVKVGNITVTGLDRTKPYVVNREVLVKTSDYWEGPKVQEMETNLKRLGIFADVKILSNASALGPEYRDMEIHVEEGEPGAFEAAAGVRSDLGLKVRASVRHSDILGKNWIGDLSADGNRRLGDQYQFFEYRLGTSITEPRLFGTHLAYSLGVAYRYERYPPTFDAETSEVFTGVERKFFNNMLSLKMMYNFQIINQFNVVINGNPSPADDQQIWIGSLTPSVTLDTRDNPFATTKGQITTFWFEYADPFLARQPESDLIAAAYYRWSGTSKWYFLLPFGIMWSNVVSGGYAHNTYPDRPIPLIKLFRLGGYSTIRGFAEGGINVDGTSIFGTLTYTNLRTQIDIPIVGDLRFGPFLDAGNLYVNEYYDVSPFLRAGSGLGLRYMTPIGPINIDFGVNLNPQNGEDPTQVHFSIGFI